MIQVGAPNSISDLTGQTDAAFYLAGLEYLNLIPTPSPAGVNSLDDSVTDWHSANSNYTVWTFNVKPGLKWSDGKNVTSADILATYSQGFALNSSYDFVGAAAEIKNEYALNSSAAVFALNQTDAHFAERISALQFTLVFPKVVTSQGAGYANLNTTITDGPFYTSNYVAGQTEMKLLRNPYFSPEPQICEIDVTFVEQQSADSTELLSGTTDFAPVDYITASSVVTNPNIHILDEKGLTIQTLQYNVTVYPFNMTVFRQALAFGINQSNIISQVFRGYGQTAYNAEGTVPQLSTEWYNPNIMQYNFSQSTSLKLLSSIGITKGSDGLLHYSNGTVVTLTLYARSDNVADPLTENLIALDLQNMGFKVNQITESQSTLSGDILANKNNIQQLGVIVGFSPTQFFGDAWISAEPGWNVYYLVPIVGSHWEYPPSADAAYQSNFTAITQTSDPAQEKTYLSNIEALNAQYLPTLVLGYPDLLWAYNSQNYNNWPSGSSYILYSNIGWNMTAWATISPVGSQSATSTNSSAASSTITTSTGATIVSSSSQPQTSASTQGSSSSTQTSSLSSSSVVSGSGSNTGLVSFTGSSAIAIAVVAVTIVAAELFRRTSRK